MLLVKFLLRGDVFMESDYKLSMLSPDHSAIICENGASDGIKARLYDIGLIEGTAVKCVGRSPSGGISAFLIRGAVIALRDEDSKLIAVNEVKKC